MKMPSVNAHDFSMVPRADVPRSRFKRESKHLTTLDAGYLVPIFLDEVLPGDHFDLDMSCFGRLITPITPIMDNVHLETFFFFVPNRLVWDNWVRQQGDRDDPEDSIDFLVPQIVSKEGGYDLHSVFDYFGLPITGVLNPGATISHSALPLRAMNLIYNTWFRDQNLIDSVVVHKDDGPDPYTDYVLLRRGKRHDYFTSCLPWPQKGDPVTLPLGTYAPIINNPDISTYGITNIMDSTGTPIASSSGLRVAVNADADGTFFQQRASDNSLSGNKIVVSAENPAGIVNWVADLGEATSATINAIRLAIQTQRLLERDARGGTRYTEIILAHFGVRSPDARLQRPEYLGGAYFPLNITPVPQTSETNETPQGNLAAFGTFSSNGNGFRQAFTEHGHVIGFISIRADLTYDRGLRKLWSRRTRYDFYMPVFAHLGEQAVLNQEIYVTGDAEQDQGVFGYQERWADMRYMPSMLTGLMRNQASGTLNIWHLAQSFTALPTLNKAFIEENPPVNRISAVPSPTGKQFLVDMFFRNICTRPMPMYSVPGMMDHF